MPDGPGSARIPVVFGSPVQTPLNFCPGETEPAIKTLIIRHLWFSLGVVITALGIVLVTKGELGTTPITSVVYVLSMRFTPTVGMFTFVMNALFVVAQAVLLRGNFEKYQWFQLGVAVLFSGVIDVGFFVLQWYHPQHLALQLLTIVFGSAVLGFGITIQIAPDVLVVPGEGITRALSIVTGKRFGTMKIALDTTLVSVGIALTFIFFHELRGIGLGTLLAAFLVGFFVNLYRKHFGWLSKIPSSPQES